MIFIDKLIDLIYPPRCIFCTKILDVHDEKGICKRCKNAVDIVRGHRCKKCSRPLENINKEYCRDCRELNHYYDQGIALYEYDGRIQEALYGLKYGGHPEYGEYFGLKMADYYKDWIIERNINLILPVPIHRMRKKKRGYNQVNKVVKTLANTLSIHYDLDLLIRVRNTKPQSHLSHTERFNNLNGAFELSGEPSNDCKNVLIIDDIYTTGSTIDHCAKILKMNNVSKVYFMTIAIAKPQKHSKK